MAAALTLIALAAGCAQEPPETREVRKAAQAYLRALARRDVKEIAERSTCVASTTTLVGGRVLAVDPARQVRMGILDSLARAMMLEQRLADSAWAWASDSIADSLFQRAKLLSNRAAVYRNASRAAAASAPGVALGRDIALETRRVRARVRYAGPVVGPRPVDTEEYLRLLRAPGGKWIVFSKYLIQDDPRPETI